MEIKTELLTQEEKVYFKLKSLYESHGYKHFKMRKFEEYSLYHDNKNFLTSEFVITFNDHNGKLFALKPDVTLSIVKNTKATTTEVEKLYYKENVYRLDKQSNEYKEISQVGVECLGQIDKVGTLEMCILALSSLKEIDENYKLCISSMGIVNAILAECKLSTDACNKIVDCMRSKNQHDLLSICKENNLEGNNKELLLELTKLVDDTKTTLKRIASLGSQEVKNCVEELEFIFDALSGTGFSNNVKLDFSIISAGDYYNGIVFKGFISGVYKAILTGGRYDKLTKKLGKDIEAMGFALYLSELQHYFIINRDYDVDTLIIYKDDCDFDKVIKTQLELIERGERVRIEKQIPPVTYKTLIKL